jgi:hypothetical protein
MSISHSEEALASAADLRMLMIEAGGSLGGATELPAMALSSSTITRPSARYLAKRAGSLFTFVLRCLVRVRYHASHLGG